MNKRNELQNLDESDLNILSNLIEVTISRLIMKSPIVKQVERLFDIKFIKKHYKNLKLQLLTEIKLDDIVSEMPKYVSLSQMFDKSKINRIKVNGIDVHAYQKLNRVDVENKYLVNLAFPCRNSANVIHNSIELLISEIKKAHDIDFNVIFQVNNTSDNTIEKIARILNIYYKLTKNTNYFILETNPESQLSLPGSLNLGFNFIKNLKNDSSIKYKEVLFSFWDDELINLIPTPDSLFNSNLNELLSTETDKAISGYMIDNRINVSKWHEISKGFSSDIRFVHSKPYLHGGSGTIMRLKDYPKEGIELGGIADTDLSACLLKEIDYKTLRKLNSNEWPVRSNPLAPVFHPIEDDILKWTIKYLMYQISWENTYKTLNEGKNKIGKLWKERIDKNRRDFHRRINNYLINLSPEKILDREFMHYYYLTVQNIKEKKALYENLKSYRKRSLEIR